MTKDQILALSVGITTYCEILKNFTFLELSFLTNE